MAYDVFISYQRQSSRADVTVGGAQLLKGHPVLLGKVSETIGDMYSLVIYESYVDLAEQLKANLASAGAEKAMVRM